MPWFQVDDQFHSGKTLRKILATEPAAVGLWTVAGSWSSSPANLTDGFVPDDVLPWLFPDALRLAEALVTARAWRRVKGGYKFNQEKNCKIPSRAIVEREREQAAERQKRRRERVSSRRESRRDDGVSHGATNTSTYNPPTPAAGAAGGPATGACEHHAATIGRPHLNCRACGTSPRGPARPSEAERHPSAKSFTEAIAEANGGTARKARQGSHDHDP